MELELVPDQRGEVMGIRRGSPRRGCLFGRWRACRLGMLSSFLVCGVGVEYAVADEVERKRR